LDSTTKSRFSIDREDKTISFIHGILKRIPILDESPTIDPTLNQVELDQEYKSRVPPEAADLTDFFLKNTGSFFLKPIIDWRKSSIGSNITSHYYVVDFSKYEKYSVRDSYHRYGGKIYFEDGRIVGYEYLGKFYAANSDFMDKIIRATLCLKMMVELHALRIHLCTAQKKLYEYAEKYPSNHPLQDFLYLSTYATLDVNRRIPILVSPYGLVVRLFGLTQRSYRKLLRRTLKRPSFNREEMLGTPGTVWYEKLNQYYQHVERFIKKLTSDEQERIDLTEFFVGVSALHNQFGDAQTYSMVISSFFVPKVYISQPGWISPLDQKLLTTLLIAVSRRCFSGCDPKESLAKIGPLD
jgi:hypothetical protein